MTSSESGLSLYERMGGEAKVKTLLAQFYDRVTADAVLAPFFEHVDMPRLLAMQQEFFSVALDGPVEYAGSRLVAAHHGRGITRHHFSRFCEHLMATLLAGGMASEEADKVLGRVAIYAGRITGEVGVDG